MREEGSDGDSDSEGGRVVVVMVERLLWEEGMW